MMNKFITLIFISLSVFALDADLKKRLKDFRDPFKRNISVLRGKKVKASKKTFFSNRTDPSNVNVQNLRVTGVFLGEKRRAIAQDTSKDNGEPFVISEGMQLGQDKIKVAAILPGGIVLIEKVKNIYDEYEYLETIIPVSE